MTDLRQAAQQALEAWDSTVLPVANDGMMQERMEILRAALEQPEQEPVAMLFGSLPVYDTAAQRPWQGLTEQDMPSGEDPMFDHQYFCAGMVYAAKVLQEKNT